MAVWLSLSLSQGTPNKTTRTTTVSATLTIHYNGGSYDGTEPGGAITIDGQVFPFVKNFNYAGVGQGASTQGSGSTSVTVTATVSYGDTSSRTVYASASFSRASGAVSKEIVLTPIGSSGGGSDGGDDDDDNTEEWDPDNPGSGSETFQEVDVNMTVQRNSASISPNGASVVRFTTPEYLGRSRFLKIVLHTSSSYIYYDMPVNVAICSSDANLSKYSKGSNTVNDIYQLEVSSTTLSISSYSVIGIQTYELKGNTDYYLILWNPSEYVDIDGIWMGVVYDIITVNIDNSSDHVDYQCFIGDGTTWIEYEVYIDNGTAFELYG
jgi:hypothetical protein